MRRWSATARLDVLVNNAGGQYFAPAEAIEPKGWRAVFNLNVGGTLNMARAAAERAMRPAGGGTIVNVTLSPHHGLTGMVHSSAARAAAEGLTRELARDGRPTASRSSRRRPATSTPSRCTSTPSRSGGRLPRRCRCSASGAEEEYGWLIALLASPLGRALSGSTVTLDGARDNWFGPWPPPGLRGRGGEVPIEARRPVRHRLGRSAGEV